MGGYDHTAGHALRPHRHLRTVVETAHTLTFWSLLELIGRQVQTRLNKRMIEHGVFFAASHEGKTGQIAEHRPGAILAVEPEQAACLWELVRRKIATNGCQTLTQFHPVATIASVAKRAEPLEGVGLTDDGAGPHHLPALAPSVARSTDVIQPAKDWRQLLGLGQGGLSGR